MILFRISWTRNRQQQRMHDPFAIVGILVIINEPACRRAVSSFKSTVLVDANWSLTVDSLYKTGEWCWGCDACQLSTNATDSGNTQTAAVDCRSTKTRLVQLAAVTATESVTTNIHTTFSPVSTLLSLNPYRCAQVRIHCRQCIYAEGNTIIIYLSI